MGSGGLPGPYWQTVLGLLAPWDIPGPHARPGRKPEHEGEIRGCERCFLPDPGLWQPRGSTAQDTNSAKPTNAKEPGECNFCLHSVSCCLSGARYSGCHRQTKQKGRMAEEIMTY